MTESDVVILDKYTPLNRIEIWSPRWHDRKILINPRKVGVHNKIVFTKDKTYPLDYYLSGKTIRKYRKESNGTIDCFVVPLTELRVLEIKSRDIREVF